VSAFGENAACDEAKANLRQLEGLLRKQSEVVERLEGELAQARARVESLTGLILKLRQELAQIPAQINSALQQGNGVLAAYFQQRYTTGLTQLNRLIAERDALEVEIPVKEAALIAPQQARSRLEREVSMAREDVRSSCSH
jgi:chromosome segregation ATPase